MGKERDGSDYMVDGGETMRNSLGRAPWGKERDGSDERVDGGEPGDEMVDVGNSLGCAVELRMF